MELDLCVLDSGASWAGREGAWPGRELIHNAWCRLPGSRAGVQEAPRVVRGVLVLCDSCFKLWGNSRRSQRGACMAQWGPRRRLVRAIIIPNLEMKFREGK